jgi:hypothetical protein
MGSEAIVVFIPLGALLLAFLSYRAARGPERVYPLVALVTSAVTAGYIASQARGGYVVWFLIWFALVSIPIGAAAHITRWLALRNRAVKAKV